MPSLFDPKENSEIIKRIQRLSPDAKPLWGKLNAAQMLKHTDIGLQIAFGEVKLKRNLIGMIFGKMAKKKLMKEEPFGKNLPTDKKFLEFGDPDFNSAKNELIKSIKRFTEQGESILTKEAHPFFGELNSEEWNKLNWKHLDHHLRQFGV